MEKPNGTNLVIFGAAGDLTWRKLMPAIYNLYLDKWLSEHFCVIGLDMKKMDDAEFRKRIREGIDKFSRRGKTEDKTWNAFASHLSFKTMGFDESAAYAKLSEELSEQDAAWGEKSQKVFYFAVPPFVDEGIANQLGEAGINGDRAYSRIIVEKPFGHDLASARALNNKLRTIFDESQIYRIDHYLGKETVQNLLVFRFANAIFEPLWNRRYIDHVQITVSEQLGVGHRGGYYDHAGAMRDMIQNHLLQLLCLIAMEPQVSFAADEIRNKKVDVLRAIRLYHPGEVQRVAVRGQYGAGWMEGEHVKGYREEPGVATDSTTETFAALKMFVDNWRWQDVPFYLRTGKRLPMTVSEVAIQFRPVPHKSFPDEALPALQPNRLIVRIQPNEGISLRFQAKQPGLRLRISPVDMDFSYCETFKGAPPEAYESLLLDAMRGDSTLFMRADQAEIAWTVIAPILEVWENVNPIDFPNYQAGTWGPEDAEVLIAQDQRTWFQLAI